MINWRGRSVSRRPAMIAASAESRPTAKTSDDVVDPAHRAGDLPLQALRYAAVALTNRSTST